MAAFIRSCLFAFGILSSVALAQDLTPELRADIDRRIAFQRNWDTKLNSPGGRLNGLEKARMKPGEGYAVAYEFKAQGLPVNLTYSLLTMPTMASRPEEIQSTAEVSIEESSGRVIDGPNDPRTVIIPDPAPGEPYRFALVSKDQKYKASVTLLPNPIEAEHNGCQVTVVRLLPNFELALVELKGFSPQTEVDFSANSEGEIHDGKVKIDGEGEGYTGILPFKLGKSKGKIELRFRAPACSPKVSFKWGKTEKGQPYQ